jgi:hypothetical protein
LKNVSTKQKGMLTATSRGKDSGDKWYVNVINEGVPFKPPPTVQAVALCGLTSTYGAALTRAPPTHTIVAPGALILSVPLQNINIQ